MRSLFYQDFKSHVTLKRDLSRAQENPSREKADKAPDKTQCKQQQEEYKILCLSDAGTLL